MDENTEMAWMLLWFKAQLPPHDLSVWLIETMPYPPATLVEGDPRRMAVGGMRSEDAVHVSGYGECARCHKRFPIMTMGNAVAGSEARVPSVVAEMKEWVTRDAERDGPCWDDVPRIPKRHSAAVRDCEP